MFDDDLETLEEISSINGRLQTESGKSKSRPNSLNGGVILLAQQLMRSDSKNQDIDRNFW